MDTTNLRPKFNHGDARRSKEDGAGKTLTQAALQQLLINLWNRPEYVCPLMLPLMPRHGYESRVIKDQFSGQQYIDWLVVDCSGAAVAAADSRGSRIHLGYGPMSDYPNITYRLEVPVRSDFHGKVYIDDVIPYGLPKGAKK